VALRNFRSASVINIVSELYLSFFVTTTTSTSVLLKYLKLHMHSDPCHVLLHFRNMLKHCMHRQRLHIDFSVTSSVEKVGGGYVYCGIYFF
jgi:hypothetical protein